MKVNEGGFSERITMQMSQTLFDDGSITIIPDGGEECEYVRIDLHKKLEAENEALKAWMDVREYPDRITEDDEIWANSVSVHIERMSNRHIWMRIGEHAFDLYSRWGKLSWIPQAGSWDPYSRRVTDE